MVLKIEQVIQNLTTGYQQFDTSAKNLGQTQQDLKQQVQNNLQDFLGDAQQGFFDTKMQMDTFIDDTVQSFNDSSKAIQAYVTALQTAAGKQAKGPPYLWMTLTDLGFELALQTVGPQSSTALTPASQQIMQDLWNAATTLRQAFDKITSTAKSIPELSNYIADVSDLKGVDDTSGTGTGTGTGAAGTGTGAAGTGAGTGAAGAGTGAGGIPPAGGAGGTTPGGGGDGTAPGGGAGGPPPGGGGDGTTLGGGAGGPPQSSALLSGPPPTGGGGTSPSAGGDGTTPGGGAGGPPPAGGGDGTTPGGGGGTSPSAGGDGTTPGGGAGGLPPSAGAAGAGAAGAGAAGAGAAGTGTGGTSSGGGTATGTGGPPPSAPVPGAGAILPPGTGATPLGGGTAPEGPSPETKLDVDALKHTDTGQEALKIQQDNKVNTVRGDPGKGSSYDPKTKILTLDPNDPNPNGTFVRKMAEADYLQKHKGDPNLDPNTASSRAAYINAELDKEAHAHAKEIEYRLETGKSINDPLGDAFQQARAAFKHDHPNATLDQLNAAGEKGIRDAIGKATAEGSKTGQTFEQFYGSLFDNKGVGGSPAGPPLSGTPPPVTLPHGGAPPPMIPPIGGAPPPRIPPIGGAPPPRVPPIGTPLSGPSILELLASGKL